MGKVVGQGRFTGTSASQLKEPKYDYDELLRCLSAISGEPMEAVEPLPVEEVLVKDHREEDIFITLVQVAVIFATLIIPIVEGLKR